MIEGAAVLVTGGTSRRIKAGDVVIIPPNTPHWWSSLEGKIVYLVVRVDPDKVVQLK
jgi:quercetin dioxygenase-like cupin family protein